MHLPAVILYKKFLKSAHFYLSKGVLPPIFKTFYSRVFVIFPTTSQSYRFKQTSNINFRNCCPTGVHAASKLEFNKFLKIRAIDQSENQILLFYKTSFTSNRSPPRWRRISSSKQSPPLRNSTSLTTVRPANNKNHLENL